MQNTMLLSISMLATPNDWPYLVFIPGDATSQAFVLSD